MEAFPGFCIMVFIGFWNNKENKRKAKDRKYRKFALKNKKFSLESSLCKISLVRFLS
jgi:hypothetical protein